MGLGPAMCHDDNLILLAVANGPQKEGNSNNERHMECSYNRLLSNSLRVFSYVLPASQRLFRHEL